MTWRRAFPLVLALAPVEPSLAQAEGLPSTRPPACSQLLAMRDETHKHAIAIRTAGQAKAPPEEACKLFKAFLASEAKMITGLQQHSALCGVPADVVSKLKGQHAQAEKVGKQVCEAAALGPRRLGPSRCFEVVRPGLSCVFAAGI